MSLTAVNVAKIVHWISIPKDERKAFSIPDIKSINYNALLLDRCYKPNLLKNNQNVKVPLLYGTNGA